jgi:hypothetical protein
VLRIGVGAGGQFRETGASAPTELPHPGLRREVRIRYQGPKAREVIAKGRELRGFGGREDHRLAFRPWRWQWSRLGAGRGALEHGDTGGLVEINPSRRVRFARFTFERTQSIEKLTTSRRRLDGEDAIDQIDSSRSDGTGHEHVGETGEHLALMTVEHARSRCRSGRLVRLVC